MPFKKITLSQENIIIVFIVLILFPYLARLQFPELNYHFRVASDIGKALILLMLVRNRDLGGVLRIFLGAVLFLITISLKKGSNDGQPGILSKSTAVCRRGA